MAQGSAGSLVVQLALDAAEYIAGLTRSEFQTRQAMSSIKKSVDEVQHTFSTFATNLSALTLGYLSFHGLVEAFNAIREESVKSEQSILQLNAALQATQGTAGLTAAGLEELAKSIEHATKFDVDDIRNAETALLRFREVGSEAFKEALKAVPDLAVALGTNLPSAAERLGRALEDPVRGIRGLRDAGVFLTETQKALIQHFAELGDKAYGQKIILDELKKSTEGAATAASEGLLGANDKLLRSFHDLEKAMGKKLFEDNIEGVKEATGFIDRMAEHISKTSFNMAQLREPFGLLKIEIREMSALLHGFNEEADKLPAHAARGKIRGLPDQPTTAATDDAAAKQREADAQVAREQDAQIVRRFQQQKAFAEKSASYYADEVLAQRAALNHQASQQEFFYSQGLISANQYYDGLRDAARQQQRETEQVLSQRGDAEEAILKSNLSTAADRIAAEGRLHSIATEGLQARIQLQQQLQQYDQQQFIANKRLQDEFSELDAKVKELSGDLQGAAQIRFNVQFETIRNQALSRGDTTRVQEIDFIQEQAARQIALNRATQEYNNLLSRLSVDQERISIAQQTGSITTLDATNKQAELAQQYIGILTRELEVQRQIAAATTDPLQRETALQRIEELRVGIEKLSVTVEALQTQFRGIFVDSISSALTDAITGTKKWSDAFKDAEKSIVRSITNIASQNIAESLFGKEGALGAIPKFFAGIFGGKGGLGGEDTIMNLVSGGGKSAATATAAAATSAFTTSVTAGTTSMVTLATAAEAASAALLAVAASAAGGDALKAGINATGFFTGPNPAGSGIPDWLGSGLPGDFFGPIMGMASGGFPAVGRPTLVGERGPELFVPRGQGQIISNSMLHSMGRRGGRSLNMTVNVLPGASKASADQAAASMALQLRKAAASNL